MTLKIRVVDYGAGNLRSIAKALEKVAPAADVQITASRAEIEAASAIVLPGDGNAKTTMEHLDSIGLVEPIRRAALAGRPFLGVCLGLQLLYDHHDEGDVAGLGILRGRARRFSEGLKVPHMGWSLVEPTQEAPILAGLQAEHYFYFVHSYYVDPEEQRGIVAVTHYGRVFPSVIMLDNIWATQFHPEKSGANGMRLLANFAATLSKEFAVAT